MKKSKFGSCWRPLMGVVAVGALALGVSALAAPRPVADSAVRGTSKGKTEVTRLVTGDPAQINAVIAGTPPTAILKISPVADKLVGNYAAVGASASGNTLTTGGGGFRAFFDVTVQDWDNNGDGVPGLHTVQVKVDAAGYLGMNAAPANDGCNLVPPSVIVCGVVGTCTAGVCVGGSAAGETCTVNADCNGPRRCRDNFGENWAKCELGFCKAGYVENTGTQRTTDNWCTPDGCNQGDVDTSSDFYRWFDIHNLPNRLDNNDPATNGIFYIGSLALDVPSCCAGTYTVSLVPSETFLADADSVQFDTAAENGFVVNCVIGSCCYGLGTPLAGCADGLTKPACDAQPQPSLWNGAGSSCVNPPTADGCAACTIPGRNTDARCNDNDACTDDDCAFPPGICSHPSIAGFDPNKPGGTKCCNKLTGALTTKDDGDVCTCDGCSEPLNRGSAVHPPCVAPCDDGNACTTPDLCDGVHSDANGGCVGTNVNTLACQVDADCPLDPLGNHYVCGTATAKTCFCTLIPNVQFVLSPSAPKTCVGGFRPGLPCGVDADCTGGGTCNNFADGANCFDDGEKITAVVHIGSAGDPINGGEFLITYDPSCVSYRSATCLSPYSTTVYGPVVNAAAGTIFIVCGVDPFGGINGPLGNTDMVSLSFTKNGQCENCELCFADANPMHSVLVNDVGQAVNIEGKCKELSGKGDLVLDVPDSIKANVDCDKPTAVVTWDPPTATFSCGDVNLSCRGVREDGGVYNMVPGTAHNYLGGGVFPQGASSFCCYAFAKDKCGQHVGCPGAANDCTGDPKPTGCWTVQVNDETSMDIDIGLEPPTTTTNRDGTLTRCIEFCLYANCAEAPLCFQDDVTFGGIFQFRGKSQGKIKIPGKGQWDCMTAQDQLHSLRSSCKSADGCLHCDGSQLVADFTGDPELGGNWLIGGNLDAYKKDAPKASLNVIDIRDFGMFLWQFGVCYADKSPDCHDGPHADINGDGCVTAADYQFIIRNFMTSSKNSCCQGDAASAPTPLAEISVDELRQMGLGELAVADLNGDGLVNAEDMDAFTQGARPTKPSNDRKGGKGLRSGR